MRSTQKQSNNTRGAARRLALEPLEPRCLLIATAELLTGGPWESFGDQSGFAELGGAHYFWPDVGGQSQLWKIDPEGEALLVDPLTGAGRVERAVVRGDALYLQMAGASGQAFWKMTTSGEVAHLADIPATIAATSALVEFQGDLYFTAQTAAAGEEIWKLTAAETVVQVTDEPGALAPAELVESAGALYFAGSSASAGRELWRLSSSGVAAPVADVWVGSDSSAPHGLTAYEGAVYFAATTASEGTQLWRYSAADGLQRVADLTGGDPSAAPTRLLVHAGQLYVATEDGGAATIWRWTVTESTQELVELAPTFTAIESLTSVAGHLLVVGETPGTGPSLWRASGSATLTSLALLPAGAQVHSFASFLPAADSLLYVVDTGSSTQLWSTSVVAASTSVVTPATWVAAEVEALTAHAGEWFAQTLTAGGQADVWRLSTLALATNLGSVAPLGGSDRLAGFELAATDPADPQGTLVYQVTSGPLHGQLELRTSPGVAITQFTQGDLDQGEVIYAHDGSAAPDDRFRFAVENAAGERLAAREFPITVGTDVAPPELLHLEIVSAPLGAQTVITRDQLLALDGQSLAAVDYRTYGGAAHGQLELTTSPGVPITAFTQADVDEGRLVYIHHGGRSATDELYFSAGDATGNWSAAYGLLMYVAHEFPWHNYKATYDVDEDNFTSTLDLARLVDALRRRTSEVLPPPNPAEWIVPGLDLEQVGYYDIQPDNFLDTLDLALFVAYLKAGNSGAVVDAAAPAVSENDAAVVERGHELLLLPAQLTYDDLQYAQGVRYTLDAAPGAGVLVRRLATDEEITSFTQADLLAGRIYYLHHGSLAAADQLQFSVDDFWGNAVHQQTLQIDVIDPLEEELDALAGDVAARSAALESA